MESMQECEAPLVPFIPKDCWWAGVTDYQKVETWILSKFKDVQFTDTYCCEVFGPVGKLGTQYKFNSDKILVRVSALGEICQNVMPAKSCPSFLFSATTA